jgi:hypothetical protein
LTADVADFPTENVRPGARIFLFGCATAASHDPVSGDNLSPGQITMSQAFSSRFHTNVQGFTVHVGFGYPGIDWIAEDYDVYHDGLHMADPITVRPN